MLTNIHIDLGLDDPHTPMARRATTAMPWKSVLGVAALALVMRVLWAVSIQSEPVSDSQAYHLLARQLASGGTYGFDGSSYVYWPVGYPFYLSLQYRLFGESAAAVNSVSIGLSLMATVLSMMLAKQWVGDDRVTVLTGLALAFYPAYIQFVTIRSSELLFTVLLLAGVVCWGTGRPLTIWRAAMTGLWMGLASYVRPLALGVVVLLALSHWTIRQGLSRTVIAATVAIAVMVIAVAPWTYRNYQVYGRFIPISTNGGMCLFFGNNPLSPDDYQEIKKPPFEGNDAERERYCTAEAMKFIRSDPVAFVQRTLRKAVRLWERETIGVVWNETGIVQRWGEPAVFICKLVSQVLFAAFGLGCLVGCLKLIRCGATRTLLAFPGLWITVAFTALYSITYSQDRYHFPLIALLAPLFGCAILRKETCRNLVERG